MAGEAAAGALRGIEVAAVVLIGLLICPPLAILATVVVLPLLVIATAVGLLLSSCRCRTCSSTTSAGATAAT